MHIQDSQCTTATATDEFGPTAADAPGVMTGAGVMGAARRTGRAAPLRVDAQRNLEHVLRAAREVFGELGYGAPMEDVARRARVGVGTVYRRFPSKDVLVRRIAEEETARLTEQARSALGQEDEAWPALARFLRTSAASGAGRLLPPQILRVQPSRGPADSTARVPQQRPRPGCVDQGRDGGTAAGGGLPAPGGTAAQDEPAGIPTAGPAAGTGPATGAGTAAGNGTASTTGTAADAGPAGESDAVRALLDVVGRLVDRARDAGELRRDVSVADVLLVIATAAPPLPDAAQHAEASARLLDILLEGLRSRPGADVMDHAAHGLVHGGAAVSPLPGRGADTPAEHPGSARD